MKVLYLDCGMGASGDMLAAALLELLPDPESFLRQMEQLGLPGVEFRTEKNVKCGLVGTRMVVTINGAEEGKGDAQSHAHHVHSSVMDISVLVSALTLPDCVKTDVMAVYGLIAQAESIVHGVPVEQVHFHEVGAMDAVADVIAVCLLLHLLRVERVMASTVHVGSGTVLCAHGILPVPAPATAQLLQGIPIYGSKIQGELCTPTGAALLKYFVKAFGPMEPMRVEKIGYGMGQKNFERANCIRSFLGESV